MYSMSFFLQAELNKATTENSSVESGLQNDVKRSSEKTGSNNGKHHSVLLQVCNGLEHDFLLFVTFKFFSPLEPGWTELEWCVTLTGFLIYEMN